MRNEKYIALLEGGLILFFSLFVIALVLKFADEIDGKHSVRYDCSLAEISPDFPIEVKQKCRELMRGSK